MKNLADLNTFETSMSLRDRVTTSNEPYSLCLFTYVHTALKWLRGAKILQHTVKVCPWCGVGLLRLYFLYCGVVTKLTLLLGSAAPVKCKGARGEVRFPGDPATMCPVLFKGSHSLLLLACCYVTYRWS